MKITKVKNHSKGHKAHLRENFRVVIADMQDRPQKDSRINEQLKYLILGEMFRFEMNILTFDPLIDEPNIRQFNQMLCQKCNVFFPDHKRLGYSRFQDDELITKFEIFDIVIVPGLAFRMDGARLGRGGGWYDRAIARLSTKCLKLGVCYSEQLATDLPVKIHDRSVDLVLCDQGIIWSNRMNIQ